MSDVDDFLNSKPMTAEELVGKQKPKPKIGTPMTAEELVGKQKPRAADPPRMTELFGTTEKTEPVGTPMTVDEFLGTAQSSSSPEENPLVGGDPSAGGVLSSGLSGINKAIAHTLGAPSDMLNAIVGRDAFGDTSKQFEELFTRMGLIAPVESPFAERVGETVGGGAAMMTPMFGVASKMGGAVGKGLDLVKQFAAKNPLKFMAGELGTSLSAGTGGAVADTMFPNNPSAEIVGEVIGGTSPALLAFTPTKMALKLIRKSIIPFTKAGARDRASARLREITGDPQSALQGMDELAGLGLTPGQASQNPGLLALEKAVVRSNSMLGIEHQQQAAMSNRLLTQTLDDVTDQGVTSATREVLEQRRQYLQGLMETRVANAGAIAQRRIETARPGMNRQQANMTLREELERSLEDARAQERQLWNTVPKNAVVSNGSTRETFENIIATRGVADDPDDIPTFVRQLIGDVDEDGVFTPGALGEAASVGDMQTLRSRILREQRAERAKPSPNRHKIGILDDLQEAVLHDLGATADNPDGEIGQAVRDALDFSGRLNARFTRGTIGTLLGFERRGGPATAAGLTGERLLASGGEKGGLGVEALTAAADTPETRVAVEEFIKNLFVTSAVHNGRVTPAAAQRFVTKHGPLLERFPALRASLSDATEAQRIADQTTATMEGRVASLHDKKVSRAALFLDAPVGQELKAMRDNGNPAGAMAELVKMVRRDPTGEAIKGLKSAYVDDLIRRVETTSFDVEGNPFLSGRRMMSLLRNESPIMAPLFNERERALVQRVAQAASQLEAGMHTAPLEKIIDDNPSMLIGLLARTIGARAGASLGSHTTGSGLVAASAGSRFVRTIVERLSADRARQLLIDAATQSDGQLMRALLADASTPTRRQFVQKKLNAWLATTGERAFDDAGAEPQPE